MGGGPPRASGRTGRERRAVTSPFRIAELEDWECHGATWRTLELSERRVVLELCSCFGEPMDRVESDDPDLIEYVLHYGELDL
jgi:hypothetical protein